MQIQNKKSYGIILTVVFVHGMITSPIAMAMATAQSGVAAKRVAHATVHIKKEDGNKKNTNTGTRVAGNAERTAQKPPSLKDRMLDIVRRGRKLISAAAATASVIVGALVLRGNGKNAQQSTGTKVPDQGSENPPADAPVPGTQGSSSGQQSSTGSAGDEVQGLRDQVVQLQDQLAQMQAGVSNTGGTSGGVVPSREPAMRNGSRGRNGGRATSSSRVPEEQVVAIAAQLEEIGQQLKAVEEEKVRSEQAMMVERRVMQQAALNQGARLRATRQQLDDAEQQNHAMKRATLVALEKLGEKAKAETQSRELQYARDVKKLQAQLAVVRQEVNNCQTQLEASERDRENIASERDSLVSESDNAKRELARLKARLKKSPRLPQDADSDDMSSMPDLEPAFDAAGKPVGGWDERKRADTPVSASDDEVDEKQGEEQKLAGDTGDGDGVWVVEEPIVIGAWAARVVQVEESDDKEEGDGRDLWARRSGKKQKSESEKIESQARVVGYHNAILESRRRTPRTWITRTPRNRTAALVGGMNSLAGNAGSQLRNVKRAAAALWPRRQAVQGIESRIQKDEQQVRAVEAASEQRQVSPVGNECEQKVRANAESNEQKVRELTAHASTLYLKAVDENGAGQLPKQVVVELQDIAACVASLVDQSKKQGLDNSIIIQMQKCAEEAARIAREARDYKPVILQDALLVDVVEEDEKFSADRKEEVQALESVSLYGNNSLSAVGNGAGVLERSPCRLFNNFTYNNDVEMKVAQEDSHIIEETLVEALAVDALWSDEERKMVRDAQEFASAANTLYLDAMAEVDDIRSKRFKEVCGTPERVAASVARCASRLGVFLHRAKVQKATLSAGVLEAIETCNTQAWQAANESQKWADRLSVGSSEDEDKKVMADVQLRDDTLAWEALEQAETAALDSHRISLARKLDTLRQSVDVSIVANKFENHRVSESPERQEFPISAQEFSNQRDRLKKSVAAVQFAPQVAQDNVWKKRFNQGLSSAKELGRAAMNTPGLGIFNPRQWVASTQQFYETGWLGSRGVDTSKSELPGNQDRGAGDADMRSLSDAVNVVPSNQPSSVQAGDADRVGVDNKRLVKSDACDVDGNSGSWAVSQWISCPIATTTRFVQRALSGVSQLLPLTSQVSSGVTGRDLSKSLQLASGSNITAKTQGEKRQSADEGMELDSKETSEAKQVAAEVAVVLRAEQKKRVGDAC